MGEKINLDVGCGRKKPKGYKGIDIRKEVNPDFLGDFRKMNFKDVDAVRAIHILEHFGRAESEKILKQWHSWLKLDGLLIIETPDFIGICERFEKCPDQMIDHVYGAQVVGAHDFHKNGWYEEKLKNALLRLGFEIMSVRKFLSKRYRNPNITIEARKR